MKYSAKSQNTLRLNKSLESLPNLSSRLSPEFSKIKKLNFDASDEVFPDWLKSRKDFQQILSNHDNNWHMHIAQICEKNYANRDLIEQNAVVSWLQSCGFTKFKDSKFIIEISKRLYTKYFYTEDILLNEEKNLDCRYFILNGEVGIYQNNKKIGQKGPKTMIFQKISEGADKNAYIALNFVVALKLDQYSQILLNQKILEKKTIKSFLKTLSCFEKILTNKLETLAELIRIKNFSFNETIFEAKQLPLDLFIIKEGMVELET